MDILELNYQSELIKFCPAGKWTHKNDMEWLCRLYGYLPILRNNSIYLRTNKIVTRRFKNLNYFIPFTNKPIFILFILPSELIRIYLENIPLSKVQAKFFS